LEDYLETGINEVTLMAISGKFDTVRRDRFLKSEARNHSAWTALYCAVHRRWLEWFDTHSPEEGGIAKERWRIATVVGYDACNAIGRKERKAQSKLIHDIFGNPFRPVILDPAWLNPTVTALAHTTYEDRTFTDLPILADALEEAGCTCEFTLSHLRGPGPHCRGCWALDLILGKN
jgi:hypothetical protein